MAASKFSELVRAIASKLKVHGFRRAESVFIRREGELYAKVYVQHLSASSKAEPEFFVNYGVTATVLMDEHLRSIADRQFGWASWGGRLREDDGRTQRVFKVSSFPSVADAADAAMLHLDPMLTKMLSMHSLSDLLVAMEAEGPATGYREREIAKLKAHIAAAGG